MIDPVEELKIRARMLRKRLDVREPSALARLRVLPELRRAPDLELEPFAANVQHKHCLQVIARELGFASFQHAQRVLSGDPRETNFGTLLYPDGWGGSYLNHWFVSHDEARHVRAQTGGYLLAYARQFFVAPRGFVEALGLDPDDPEWEQLGWDWARPRESAARTRLYGKLLAARGHEGH